MSLLRLGNKETVASLLASSLLFFLKLLNVDGRQLQSHEAALGRDPHE